MTRRMMQLANRNQMSTFWRYLISYLIVFLIPSVLILLFFYPRMREITTRKAFISLEAELSQYQQNIDTQITTIIQYSDIFFRNKDINQNMLKSNNEFDHYLLKQEMRTMTGGNAFAQTTFYYNKYTHRFISKDSNYSMNHFMGKNALFQYLNWPVEDMYAKLQAMNEIYIHPSDTIVSKQDNDYQGITMFVPVPYPHKNPFGVLMTTISRDRLFSYLSRSSEGHVNLVIAGIDGEVLASSQRAEYMGSEEFVNLLRHANNDFDTISLLGERYIVHQKASALGMMKFFYIAPLDEILGEVNAAVKSIFILLGILFVSGTFLIVWFMRINYSPIHRIREKLSSTEENLPQKDDISFITSSIVELKKQNESLFEKVMMNKNIAMEYFLIRLINGNFENEELLQRQAKDCGVSLKEYICCIAFGSVDRNIIKVLDSIKRMLSDHTQATSNYYVKGLQHEDFTVILSFSKESEIKHFVYELYNLDKNICIGIGSMEKLDQVNKSYTLSLAALEYGLHHHEMSVTSYNDLQYEDYYDMKETVNKLKDMELSIVRKNGTGLQSNVLQIRQLLDNEKVRNVLKKTIYISTYNILVKGLQEFDSDREYIYALPQRELDLDDAKGKIMQMQDQLSRCFETANQSKAVTPDKVLAYVQENYKDPCLSLACVAEAFAMSYSNFSHFFKKNAGISFIQYLEKLRIDECKQLLTGNNYTIEQLAQQSGYNNSNSLARAFKKSTGMSPSQYRKHKKDHENQQKQSANR